MSRADELRSDIAGLEWVLSRLKPPKRRFARRRRRFYYQLGLPTVWELRYRSRKAQLEYQLSRVKLELLSEGQKAVKWLESLKPEDELYCAPEKERLVP